MTLALVGASLLVASVALAATTYSYKCPRCGLIQQYTKMGIYKCPTDGSFMTPQP
ncbi:hypothetical protein BH09VER1_BH09VER1_23880 [soil metagenome]